MLSSGDARAPFRIGGTALVVASAIGLCLFVALRPASWTAEQCEGLARVALLAAFMGCVIVFVVAVLDASAENRAPELPMPRLDLPTTWWEKHIGAPRPTAHNLERMRALVAASRRSRIAVVAVLVAMAPVLWVYAALAAA
jgi:hypothetical protein